jgi:hypothetical protein
MPGSLFLFILYQYIIMPEDEVQKNRRDTGISAKEFIGRMN